MSVNQQLTGVIEVDESRSPGGAGGLQSQECHKAQQEQAGKGFAVPIPNQVGQGDAGAQRADESQKEGAGGL